MWLLTYDHDEVRRVVQNGFGIMRLFGGAEL